MRLLVDFYNRRKTRHALFLGVTDAMNRRLALT